MDKIALKLLVFPLLIVATASTALDYESVKLRARQQITGTGISTCGYVTGDPTKPRTANDGYHCAYDATFGLWGFCTDTVLAVGDCGLMGRCTDSYSCTAGCGKPAGVTHISQLSW
jgi:hypothetical protein